MDARQFAQILRAGAKTVGAHRDTDPVTLARWVLIDMAAEADKIADLEQPDH